MDLTNKILKHNNGDVIKPVKRLHGFNNKETEFYSCTIIKDFGEELDEYIFPIDKLHLMTIIKEVTIEED